jgi:hypothetical protein
VARLAAELRRFHVLDGPIGKLGSDEHVKKSSDTEKPNQSLQRRLAVESRFRQALSNSPIRKINTNRDQQQAREKNCRQDQENYYSDVGIIGVSPDLNR